MTDASTTAPAAPAAPAVRPVRPDREVSTRQRLPYFVGISGRTVGARGLSMHLVVIPPGARADAHSHRGHETGIYVLEGRVETRWGPHLEHSVVSEAGDFLFIPPGVPHEAINLSATEPARAVVARDDPAEQDNVVAYRPDAPDAADAPETPEAPEAPGATATTGVPAPAPGGPGAVR